MSKSSTTSKLRKPATLAATALVLGSGLATAPEIMASPDSQFIQSAYAAEGKQVTPTNITITPVGENTNFNTKTVTWDVNFDFSGQQVKAGDYFDLNYRIADGGTFENPTLWGKTDPQVIARFTDANTDENKKAVYVGKTVSVGPKDAWNTPVKLPTELKRADGTVMATVKNTWQGTRVTFTEAAENREDVQGSFQHEVGYGTNGSVLTSTDRKAAFPELNQMGYNANIDGGFTDDQLRALPNASPYYGVEVDKPLPAGVYVNGEYKTSTGITPAVGGYIKQPRELIRTQINSVNRTGSAEPVNQGILRFGQEGMDYAKPADIGNRQTITFQVNEDTKDYLKFNFDNWKESGGYTISKAYRLPNGQLVKTDQNRPDEIATLAGPPVNHFSEVSNKLSSLDQNNPYQLRMESYNNETGTITFSWVPMDEGDHIRFQFEDKTNPVVWNTDKAIAESKINGYNFTTTHSHTNADSVTAGNASSWFYAAGEADGVLSPKANPETSETEANTPVTTNLISNDTFPESSYGTTTVTKQPANGTVTINPDGTAVYTPNPGFTGEDVVTYKNTNANGKTSNETTWTITVKAPAAPVANPDTAELDYQGTQTGSLTGNDTANGKDNRIKPETAEWVDRGKTYTVDGITVTINPDGTYSVDASNSNSAGTWEIPYKVQDNYGQEATSTLTIKVGEPTVAVSIKTLINGEDANDPNNPVILPPGEYTVTHQLTNPNKYPLGDGSLVLTADGKTITLPAGTEIAPGATIEITDKVTLEKQGSIAVTGKLSASYNYHLNGETKNIKAEATDPAYAKAVTGEVTAQPDSVRVRTGEEFSIPLLTNDTTTDGYKLVPSTVKLTGWEDNGDGTFTHPESGITVQVSETGILTGKAGQVEGLFEGLTYTVENELGDISAPTSISVEVFNFHVDLEALVGAEKLDADSSDEAFKVTVPHDQESTTQPVTLKYTNTGKDPIMVEGFIQVNTSDDGSGWSYKFDEPRTLAPGETAEYTVDLEFAVGEHTIDFKVLTSEGVEDTDPIMVVVDQEPAPEPTPEPDKPGEVTKEEETPAPVEPTKPEQPKVEQQKPTAPAPVIKQEKPKAPAPVFVNTGLDGVTVEARTAAQLEEASQLNASGEGGSVAQNPAWYAGALAAFAGAFAWLRRKKQTN